MPPKPPRTPQLVTRLSELDQQRFQELLKAQNKPAADLLRAAVRHYLDYCDAQVVDYRESVLERRLKQMEDRLAALIARTAIDVGTIYQVLWHRSDPAKRQSLFAAARTQSIGRLRQKLAGDELDLKRKLVERAAVEEADAS